MHEKWNDYFITIAAAVSKRSTCLRRHYGAVIVNDDRKIIATGYNGACRGQPNCCDIGTCIREEMHIPHGERYELCKSVHAEQNAIINGAPNEMKNSTLYIYGESDEGKPVDAAPCLLCQRMIANACIRKVTYITPTGLVTYLVNPSKDKLYCRVRINFSDNANHIDHDEYIVTDAFSTYREAKEYAASYLEDHGAALRDYCDSLGAGNDSLVITVTDVDDLTYDEYRSSKSFVLA